MEKGGELIDKKKLKQKRRKFSLNYERKVLFSIIQELIKRNLKTLKPLGRCVTVFIFGFIISMYLR